MHRRGLLKLGVGSAVVLAVAGGTLAWLAPGLQDGRLAPASREIFARMGAAVLEGTLSTAAPARQRELEALLVRVGALVSALPPHAQSELSQLLALLATPPGRLAIAGLQAPWPQASVEDCLAALQSMRLSSVTLRQQAYHALHDIVNGAYFSEPSTWGAMGYPGPLAL